MGEILSLPINDAAPIEPMRSPIVLLDDGSAWVPSAFIAGAYENLPVCEGVALGWQPAFEVGKAVLVFQGGNPAAPTREVVTAELSRAGLRALIAGLQSIDAQWGDQ